MVDEPIRTGWLDGEPVGDVEAELDGVEKLLVPDIVVDFDGENAKLDGNGILQILHLIVFCSATRQGEG